MDIRIDFKSGNWLAIDKISGVEVVENKLCVNLTFRSTIDNSCSLPDQEHDNDLRRDYCLEEVEKFSLSE